MSIGLLYNILYHKKTPILPIPFPIQMPIPIPIVPHIPISRTNYDPKFYVDFTNLTNFNVRTTLFHEFNIIRHEGFEIGLVPIIIKFKILYLGWCYFTQKTFQMTFLSKKNVLVTFFPQKMFRVPFSSKEHFGWLFS